LLGGKASVRMEAAVSFIGLKASGAHLGKIESMAYPCQRWPID
jgi:hypothetical protein